MNIGLDYDDTFAADKTLWTMFILNAKERGHDVRFVTFRFEHPNGYSNDDLILDASKLDIPVIFTNGIQKDDVTRSLGFFVDVWIDDFPLAIPSGDHVVGMAKGIHVNDFRNRKPPKEIAKPVYSEEPLIIK